MAKKIVGFIKLQVPAGKANPSPPIGPALGQRGLTKRVACASLWWFSVARPLWSWSSGRSKRHKSVDHKSDCLGSQGNDFGRRTFRLGADVVTVSR